MQHRGRLESVLTRNGHHHLFSFPPDVCMGGNDGTPESFIKAILDTQTASIDPYARSVVDHYILNVSEDDSYYSSS